MNEEGFFDFIRKNERVEDLILIIKNGIEKTKFGFLFTFYVTSEKINEGKSRIQVVNFKENDNLLLEDKELHIIAIYEIRQLEMMKNDMNFILLHYYYYFKIWKTRNGTQALRITTRDRIQSDYEVSIACYNNKFFRKMIAGIKFKYDEHNCYANITREKDDYKLYLDDYNDFDKEKELYKRKIIIQIIMKLRFLRTGYYLDTIWEALEKKYKLFSDSKLKKLLNEIKEF